MAVGGGEVICRNYPTSIFMIMGIDLMLVCLCCVDFVA